MTDLPFPPQTEIGVHPDEGDKRQVNEHESQGPLGMFVHRCLSSLYELPTVSRNARRQSISVMMPTRASWSTTGKQPYCRCRSRRVACTMSMSGAIDTTSCIIQCLIGIVAI